MAYDACDGVCRVLVLRDFGTYIDGWPGVGQQRKHVESRLAYPIVDEARLVSRPARIPMLTLDIGDIPADVVEFDVQAGGAEGFFPGRLTPLADGFFVTGAPPCIEARDAVFAEQAAHRYLSKAHKLPLFDPPVNFQRHGRPQKWPQLGLR